MNKANNGNHLADASLQRRVYRPSELNREARIHLEAGFGLVWVEGEISNLSRPASGHLYFSIKDNKAQIRCAFFRNRAMLLNTKLENGMQAQVSARVSLYEPRGDYQLIVEHVQAAGEGRLLQLYEALKKKLATEGLFDEGRKRPLPALPRCLGLITSPSGAAIRDLLHVLERRYPLARVRIYPSAVQGMDAPAELRRALATAIDDHQADLLILARGGGSLEDLWAFNDEQLTRAVAASPIPTISAIGHEVDYSLTDFAADVRAPTPSAAAEIATPDRRELYLQIKAIGRRLQRDAMRNLQQSAQQLDYLVRRLQQAQPQRRLQRFELQLSNLQRRLQTRMQQQLQHKSMRLRHGHQRLLPLHPQRQLERHDNTVVLLHKRLQQSARLQVERADSRFRAAAHALHQISPLAVLGRGYAIVRDTDSDAIIGDYKQAKKSSHVTIRGSGYTMAARVLQVDSDDMALNKGEDGGAA